LIFVATGCGGLGTAPPERLWIVEFRGQEWVSDATARETTETFAERPPVAKWKRMQRASAYAGTDFEQLGRRVSICAERQGCGNCRRTG